MNPRFAKFLANPHARAEIEAAAELAETGAPAPAQETPAAATALELVDKGDRWIGPCPACREDGRDNAGNHLVLWPDGRFGCVCNPGDAGHDHRVRMAELAPELCGSSGGPRRPRVDFEEEKAAIQAGWDALWVKIEAGLGGGLELLGESAPIPSDPFGQFEVFCRLFAEGDTAWCGTLYDIAEDKWELTEGTPTRRTRRVRFRDNLFAPADPASRAAAWERIETVGLDLASGLVRDPNATSRSDEFVTGRRFLVVERDNTPLEGQVAAIRYARGVLGWPLAYVVNTGRGNLHGIFDARGISPTMCEDGSKILAAVGCDAGALSHSRTRIPGAIRGADGKGYGGQRQEILYIDPSWAKGARETI